MLVLWWYAAKQIEGRVSRLEDIFGYKPGKGREYLDLGLTAVAIIGSLWALVGLQMPKEEFDFKLGIVAALVAAICIRLTSDPLLAAGIVSGFICIRGLIGYLETGESVVLPVVGISAAILLLVIRQARRRGR